MAHILASHDHGSLWRIALSSFTEERAFQLPERNQNYLHCLFSSSQLMFLKCPVFSIKETISYKNKNKKDGILFIWLWYIFIHSVSYNIVLMVFSGVKSENTWYQSQSKASC